MHVPVILGTARVNCKSAEVAQALVKQIERKEGYSTELVAVKDHVKEAVTVPPWGEGGANTNPTEWKRIVNEATSLVLVIPEYNHSFPGELKLLLDSLWDDYLGKTVGLVGVSAGSLGGARVIDHIKPVLTELKLFTVKEAVNIAKVSEAVNEDGDFVNAKTSEYVDTMLEEITKLAQALKTLDK